jgi:hypothetical protein
MLGAFKDWFHFALSAPEGFCPVNRSVVGTWIDGRYRDLRCEEDGRDGCWGPMRKRGSSMILRRRCKGADAAATCRDLCRPLISLAGAPFRIKLRTLSGAGDHSESQASRRQRRRIMHLDPSSLSILRTIFGMGLLAFVMGPDVRGARFREARNRRMANIICPYMSVRYRSGPLPPLAEPKPPSADGVIASAFDQGRPHGPWHAHVLRRSASVLVLARTRRDHPKRSASSVHALSWCLPRCLSEI